MGAAPVWNGVTRGVRDGALEGRLGPAPERLRIVIALPLALGMLAIPALVLSSCVVICFGLAIGALWKVVQTNLRTRD
jgi:hypothetical protein